MREVITALVKFKEAEEEEVEEEEEEEKKKEEDEEEEEEEEERIILQAFFNTLNSHSTVLTCKIYFREIFENTSN